MFKQRAKGPFIDMQESSARLEALIAKKKTKHGL
jgi:hypothetical protein